MSRQKRKLSKTGLYHVIFRGISRQNIFEEAADYKKLIEIIRKVKLEMQFELYAYCFMTNHVHLFIKEKNTGEISKIMSKMLSHYATWFNIKYMRSGALFSNRYNSEPVEDDRYYLGLIRYIHQNPLKANMVQQTREYPYSSYHEYSQGKANITDIDFLLNMLNDDEKKATSQFIELHESTESETFEITSSPKKNHEYIRRLIMSEIGGKEPAAIKSMSKENRDKIVKKLVNEKHISKSALERATGISRGTIVRICNKKPNPAPRRQLEPSFLD